MTSTTARSNGGYFIYTTDPITHNPETVWVPAGDPNQDDLLKLLSALNPPPEE